MARTPDLALKRNLLDQVVAYLAAHGLGDASLRPMAGALGVSVNALVHHFGTKDELVVAALDRAVAIQDEVRAAWLRRNPRLSQADLLRRWWRWILAAPEHVALVRLGLEAGVLEATASGLTGQVRADQIGLWRANIEQRLITEGMAPTAAAVEASLTKAMFTGLVLDLLATGDRRRLTRALEVGLGRLEQLVSTATGLTR